MTNLTKITWDGGFNQERVSETVARLREIISGVRGDPSSQYEASVYEEQLNEIVQRIENVQPDAAHPQHYDVILDAAQDLLDLQRGMLVMVNKWLARNDP